jgi:ribonuclease Y
VLGTIAGYIWRKAASERKVAGATERAGQIVAEAERKADSMRKEAQIAAKEEIYRKKEEFDREADAKRKELQNLEKRLTKREDNLDKKTDIFNKKEKQLDDKAQTVSRKEEQLDRKHEELEEVIEGQKVELQRITGLSRDEARELLLAKIESEVTRESNELIAKRIGAAREEADRKARNIVGLAVQRCAADHTAEITVSSIDIPSDDMKGRIIGREGRNIRSFEKATGVDVIVDDTPGVVVVSAFDSVRREVARRAMDRLIADGRIHPARIEEIVAESQKEVDDIIKETGKQTCYDFGLHNIHPKEVLLLGRLRFRTSYGQNVLQHSKEVAYLCSAMAGELGIDVNMATRCGLLHDIGKAVDHEIEGGHPAIGADIAKRCGERPEVVNAIAAHHEDVDPRTLYAVITQAADAISAARPGARRETLERYIKRLRRLEEVAENFSGVHGAFAIQAGRELRVIVNADKVNDRQAAKMARDIANQVEQELNYPGEIKIALVRETRVIEYAR